MANQIIDKPEDVDMTEEEWLSLSAPGRWYYRNKEEHKKNVKEHRDNRVEWYREWRDNDSDDEWVCVECGEDHPATIQFHHTEQNEYEMALSIMVREGYGKDTTRDEFERGEVLCANCHRIKHYNDNSGPFWWS